MKVGDIVKQGGQLVQLDGKLESDRKKLFGTVVAIHENLFPEGAEL